jgi:putative AlgH/UPF0301 family transcriptional regulator
MPEAQARIVLAFDFGLRRIGVASGDTVSNTAAPKSAIQVTTSRDVLAAIARGEGPHGAFVALGYAGWDAGQLEREMLDNAWLSLPIDERRVF